MGRYPGNAALLRVVVFWVCWQAAAPSWHLASCTSVQLVRELPHQRVLGARVQSGVCLPLFPHFNLFSPTSYSPQKLLHFMRLVSRFCYGWQQ